MLMRTREALTVLLSLNCPCKLFVERGPACANQQRQYAKDELISGTHMLPYGHPPAHHHMNALTNPRRQNRHPAAVATGCKIGARAHRMRK